MLTPEASPSRFSMKIVSRKDTADANSVHLPVLWCPCIRIKKFRIPDRLLVMANRNYKVYADLGLNTDFIVIFLTVLDTGANPNFVLESFVTPAGAVLYLFQSGL